MQNKVHTRVHPLLAGKHNGVWLTGILLCLLVWAGCRANYTVGVSDTRQYTIGKGDDTARAPDLEQLLTSYRDSLNRSMLEPLAWSRVPMTRELPEGNLGNFCADACFKKAAEQCRILQLPEPDFVFLNHGGLRASLPMGNITTGNVFELMPFENELVALRISRQITDSVLDIIASKGGAPVSGLMMNIRNGKAEHKQWLNNSTASTDTLTVITSDYLATGNDGYEVLKNTPFIRLNLKVRDALLEDLREHGQRNDTLNIRKDGRIQRY